VNYLGGLLLVAGFGFILHALGLVAKATEAASLARRSMADLRDPALDDDAKEAAMRAYAAQLFWLFAVLTLGSAVALAIPLAILYLLDVTHLLSLAAVLETVVQWPFIVATVVLYVAGWLILRKR
jgi:hypothetical protein